MARSRYEDQTGEDTGKENAKALAGDRSARLDTDDDHPTPVSIHFMSTCPLYTLFAKLIPNQASARLWALGLLM